MVLGGGGVSGVVLGGGGVRWGWCKVGVVYLGEYALTYTLTFRLVE